MDWRILYEDKDLCVCEKPAGLPVQTAGVSSKDLVSELRAYLAGKTKGSGVPYLGVVHRLDQPVHGVMVFAKTKEAAASLSAQAADGRMKKVYRAVTSPAPAADAGTLVNWLVKDGRTNTSRAVPEGTKGARRAELDFRVLERRGERALLEIVLHSGRHHQIRVQTAAAGIPLLGDRKYGTEAFPALCLCAASLVFTHPRTKKTMRFSCEPGFELW